MYMGFCRITKAAHLISKNTTVPQANYSVIKNEWHHAQKYNFKKNTALSIEVILYNTSLDWNNITQSLIYILVRTINSEQ